MARAQIEHHPASRNLYMLPVVSLISIFLLIMALLASAKTGNIYNEANLLYAALISFGAASALYLGFGITGTRAYIGGASVAAWVGLAATTLAVTHRWYIAGRPPFSNIYEMLLSFVWTLAALTVFIERKYGVKIVGTVTMPLAVVSVLLMQLLPSDVRPLVPALQSTWLHIHVTLAMLAYAACAVSFALALMFLIQDRVRTETFLAGTGALLAAIYFGIATRFDATGGLRVAAWDFESGRELFISERAPLWVVIPSLGWLFFIILVFAVLPVALWAWANWNRNEAAFAWANRIFFVGAMLQLSGLIAFIIRVRMDAYPSPQTEGVYLSHLSASPFILAGLVSGIFASILYLLLMWRRNELSHLLPAAETLDRLTYKTIGIAFPLLTLMIAAGAYWANRTWGTYWNWDPKETWALITWLVYAGYLHMRITKGWRGRRAAYFAIVGFAVVLFTFFGVTYLLPGLHAYGG